MARRPNRRQREVLSSEIIDTILGYIRSHWYREAPVEAFLKDRSRLLEWVVFEAARKLDEAAVNLPGERYLEIYLAMLRDAGIHGSRATYIPAYLRHVAQTHWRINWDRYYDEAKAVTPRIEEMVRGLGSGVGRKPDPIRELAAASNLLANRRKAVSADRRETRAAAGRQMDLL